MLGRSLADYAKQASRETSRWYGQRQFFAAPKKLPKSCEQFWLDHWRRFPSTDPTGGQIIDGEAVEITGFIE